MYIDYVCSWYFGCVRGASAWKMCMSEGGNQVSAMNECGKLIHTHPYIFFTCSVTTKVIILIILYSFQPNSSCYLLGITFMHQVSAKSDNTLYLAPSPGQGTGWGTNFWAGFFLVVVENWVRLPLHLSIDEFLHKMSCIIFLLFPEDN